MKAGAILLCLLWFSAAAFAGYHLTAWSFAWVDQPNFGLPQVASPVRLPDLPPQLTETAKTLTPQQMLCLRAAVSPDHYQAALQGHLTPQEAAAVEKCLK